MANNFYPTNNEVLKFDIDKDLLELRFNHWITRKENLQRSDKKDVLDRGLFKMTIRMVENDLGVTFQKARTLVKKFEKLGIIELKIHSKSKHESSIYAYTSVFYNEEKSNTVKNTVDNTVDNTVKPSKINKFGDISNTVDNTVNNTVNNTSKKEKKKENIKTLYVDTSIEVQLSELLYKLILKNNPKFKKPNIQTWCDSVNKMIRLDGRGKEDIEEVIKWCQNDDFWSVNILSTKKLREKFDMLYAKMSKEKTPSAKGEFRNNSYNGSICNTNENNSRKDGLIFDFLED